MACGEILGKLESRFLAEVNLKIGERDKNKTCSLLSTEIGEKVSGGSHLYTVCDTHDLLLWEGSLWKSGGPEGEKSVLVKSDCRIFMPG